MSVALAHVRLLLDIFSIKLLVWTLGRDGELLDSHLFFYHRYSALADYHRFKGDLEKADRLDAIAEAHYQAAPGDDDDDPAAAMAMPVPRPPIGTNAVGVPLPTSRAKTDRADGFPGGAASLPSPAN